MKTFVTPVLAAILGFISLFMDPKRSKVALWLLAAGLVVTAAIDVTMKVQEQTAQESAVKAAILREEGTKKELSTANEHLSTLRGLMQAIPDLIAQRLVDQGYSQQKATTATPVSAARSIEADASYRALLNTRPSAPSGVRVEYFPKDVDGDKVIAAMERAGLDVVRKTAVQNAATNAVWVGDSVPIEDARLVGLTLLRAGTELVAIRRFHDGGGAKARLIQVGADAALVGKPPLTVPQISALTLPPR